MSDKDYIMVGGERVPIGKPAPPEEPQQTIHAPVNGNLEVFKKLKREQLIPKSRKGKKPGPKIKRGPKPGPGSMQTRIALPTYLHLMEMAAAQRLGPQAMNNKVIEEKYAAWKEAQNG